MSVILSVVQQKGGVAKTTSVANIGAAFALRQNRVLVVDCDPQGSLTLALGHDSLAIERTIGDAMLDGGDIPIVETAVENLHLCPSARHLADVEYLLAPKVGREKFLARTLERASGYDFILLDSPPSLGLLTINGMTSAHALLVPVTPTILGTAGLRDLLATVEEVKSGIKPDLHVLGAFITFADRRSVAGARAEDEIREDLGEIVFAQTISRRIAHEYATQAGTPIIAAEPKSIAALEYAALAEEILHRVTA
jgi:chromosome partitioning protein